MESTRENALVVDETLMGEIIPGLWIGSLWSVKELRKMAHNKRWTVISIIKSERANDFVRRVLAEKSSNVERHEEWELEDQSQSSLISDRLEEILAVMDEALDQKDKCCLVHCAFGVSRSASVCAAWLISRRQLSLQQALQQIRVAREAVSPNIGFIAGLRALEQCKGNVKEAQKRMRERNKG